MKKKELLARIEKLELSVAKLETAKPMVNVPSVWYGHDIAKATTVTTWPPNGTTPLGGNL